MQDIDVARQLAREHENRLRQPTGRVGVPGGHHLRFWIGHALVRTGTWLLGDAPMRRAAAIR